MEQCDLDKRFTYHPPVGDQAEMYVQIRNKSKELAELINKLAPESREKSLAMTKIEEAVMWANASIARGGINMDKCVNCVERVKC